MSRAAFRHARKDVRSANLSTYDRLVLADNPILYLPLYGNAYGYNDQSGNGNHGVPQFAPGSSTFLNGDGSTLFNGTTQYVEISDSDALSISTTGMLTIEAWIRPDVLTFPTSEGSGYVHWMGKYSVSLQNSEWQCRMYNQTTTDVPMRPNRISGYAFNLNGGLGVGAYFQDTLNAGEWIHYVACHNVNNTSANFPTGYARIYKNGIERNQQAYLKYNIVPANGNAPMRIGTTLKNSYFQGAIAKVAIYPYELSPAAIRQHHEFIRPSPTGSTSFIKTVGTINTKTSGTQLALTLTNQVSAGSTLVVTVAHDWTSGGPTVADSRGNTYTRDRTTPSADTTLRSSIFSAPIHSALQPGDTILLTTSASVAAKVMAIHEFAGVTFTSPLDTSVGHASTLTNPGSGTTLTNTNADDLLVSMLGVKGPTSETYTDDAQWTGLTRDGTTGGAATSNVTLNSAFKILNAIAGTKYQPTLGTAETSVELIAAYKAGPSVPVPPAAGSVTFIQTIGNATAQTSGTLLSITVPASIDEIPVGHTLIIRTLHTGSAVAVPSIGDTHGNTYTNDRSAPNGGGNLRIGVFSCSVTTALTAGDVITITWPSAVVARIATIDEFAGIAGPTIVVEKNSTSGNSAAPAISLVTTNADALLVGAVGVAGDVTDPFTEDVLQQWTTLQRVGTTGGVFTDNLTLDSAYRSVGNTNTYSYGPTLETSSNWIDVIAAYKAGAVVITPPAVGTATFVKNVGTASASSSGSTLSLTVAAGGVPTGHTVIVKTVSDYLGPPTVTDSRGNTYTLSRTQPNTAQTLRGAVFLCNVTTNLQAGDAITVTFSSSITNRVASADEFSTVLTPVVIDAQNGTSGVSTTPNVGATTVNADDLLIGVVGVLSNVTDGYTEDSANLWTTSTRVGTSALVLNSAYRAVPAVAQYRYQPTLGVSASWVELVVAFKAG